MLDLWEARVLCADAQPDIRALTAQAGILPVGFALSAQEAVRLTCEWQPDALILSATLPGGDGAAVIRAIRAHSLERMPAVLLLAVPGMDAQARMAREAGACRVLEKPVEPALLSQALRELKTEDRLCPNSLTEERVKRILTGLCVPAHLSGYKYLVRAIMLAGRDAELTRRLTGELYPQVAQGFGTGARSVERAIRGALESAWTAGELERQYAFFQNRIDERRGKPTNGEFIARVTDAVRMEE